MGSICSKKKESDGNSPPPKMNPTPISAQKSRTGAITITDERISEDLRAGSIEVMRERASELIQEITVLDGHEAEQEMYMDQTNDSLAAAIQEGNAVLVAVLNKAVKNGKTAMQKLSDKRLQLETDYYELQGNIMDFEDAKYSALLCSAIDTSQTMRFPLLAVSFKWLTSLESLLKDKYPDKGASEFTMSFLSKTYIPDETMTNGLSLCDHFISEAEGKRVGLATHYVVYSQTMILSEFMDSLHCYFNRNGMSTPDTHQNIFVWVDVFSFTQDSVMLQSLELTPMWFYQCLAPALTLVAKAIIVLDHKNINPVLKSSWALMEVYLICTSNIQVEITMSRTNSKLLVDEASMKGVRRVFPQIATLNLSTCSINGKKEEITAALETLSSNESEFHETIKNCIDELMSNYLYELMASFREDSNLPYVSLVACILGNFCQVHLRYDESEQSFKYSLKIARQIYGNLDPRTIRIVKQMIKFYEVTGAFDKAEDLRNFGKPNRDAGGGNIVMLKGADIQVVSSKHQD